MKIRKYFNYKDWWTWTSWIILLYIIIDGIFYLDTLQRWKWGYWSIDLIPHLAVLVLLWMLAIMIILNRQGKLIREIENLLNEKFYEK